MLKRIHLAVLLLIFLAPVACALQPDELALIINKRMPQGRQLAEQYAKARSVPMDRIIEIDVPANDEISFDDYERGVVPPIKAAIRSAHLEDKIKCLVPFYGVPLRIGPRHLSADEKQEISQITTDLDKAKSQIDQQISLLESLAGQLDQQFVPIKGTDVETLAKRGDAASHSLMTYGMRTSDASIRDTISQHLGAFLQIMSGKVGFYDQLLPQMSRRPMSPSQKEKWQQLGADVEQAKKQLIELTDQRFDPQAREKLRDLLRKNFGLMGYARQLNAMLEYFGDDETIASVDSELSVLWIPFYPRSKWIVNPLYYKLTNPPPAHMVMVSRLDGPSPDAVSRIITDSIKVERRGLHGQIVCDSRGLKAAKPGVDAYADYDQTIRDFAQLIRDKTKLQLTLDESSQLISPHSAKNVALYIGWYRLRNYEPSCDFAPGAVAFHVASLEMVSLRASDEQGWCRGLLRDGCVATLGAVAEPYLSSFPAPDDFFPLLMTGKLTLAETYWRTCPMASWKQILIGDPLYTPYKTNPPLTDLPERLQSVLIH